MQTPENWLSLNSEALKIPRIFTLARRGLKPISNDTSQILKYILSICQLILKQYILNPEGKQRKTQNWKRIATTWIQNATPYGWRTPKRVSKSTLKKFKSNRKVPATSPHRFFAKPVWYFNTSLKSIAWHFLRRRVTLSEFEWYFSQRHAIL